MKPRCVAEFCCNRATKGIFRADRSGQGRPAIDWGWCDQHALVAWGYAEHWTVQP